MNFARLGFGLFATAACFRKMKSSVSGDVLGDSDACWAQLNGLALDEGNGLGEVNAVSADDCERACDSTSGCNSFSYCPQWGKCWLKDRSFAGCQPTRTNGECRTHYKTSCAAPTPAPTSGPPAPTPSDTCESQWGNLADCITCGDRVTSLINDQGYTSSAAQTIVGFEFPAECGACMGPTPAPTPGVNNCLCVFDIDRTLTGKQGDTSNCPRNRNVGLYDAGYGGGDATLSALANQGINSTFCNDCYLGICSAGSGSGESSDWNAYILDNIMRSSKQDQHPEWRTWSYGTIVRSPWVLNQGNRVKQDSVELIRQWYGVHGIPIEPSQVFFYEDRTENVQPFSDYGLNSYEISCGSRDWELYAGSGMVGYCGATPEEIVNTPGNRLCE